MIRPLTIRGDAGRLPIPDASVDLIVTSPPYFALRSYTDGGQHYAGQIGAEPTPAEYIAALVACTREWTRVLKPTGSIFVNLGDSFSKGQRLDSEFTVEDAAWLAGVLDSDGSISVHKQGTSYTAWTRVGQMRPEVVHRIREVTGIGQVFQDKRGVWNWNAAAQQASAVLARVWPWLQIKRGQALAAVELQSRKAAVGGRGRWNALTPTELAHRERIRTAVLNWNSGTPDDYEPPLLPLPDLPLKARWVPPKSLLLLPERYRVACVDQLGLFARSVIIWSKPNGLPESVTDRVRRSHEDWVHLTKQPRYFAAVDEIREPHLHPHWSRPGKVRSPSKEMRGLGETSALRNADYTPDPLGKLPGSVWTVATEPLRKVPGIDVDHFAAFPTEWPRRLILGWSPAGICTACGDGRRPVTTVEREHGWTRQTIGSGGHRNPGEAPGQQVTNRALHTITGYTCACPDTTAPTRPAVIVDPFGGTGTTAHVAAALGRAGISVDLSADYCRLAASPHLADARLRKVLGYDKAPAVPAAQGDLFADPG